MKRALLTLALTCLLLPASAQAMSYPAQRPAGPLVNDAMAVAVGFWENRDVSVNCGQTVAFVAALPLLGHAEPMQCAIWIDASLVRYAHARSRFSRYWGRAMLCRFVVHEVGHLGNLEHSPDPDSVMAEAPRVDPSDCLIWARQTMTSTRAMVRGLSGIAASRTAARTRQG